MEKRNTESIDSKKHTDDNKESLTSLIQKKFPEKTKEEIEKAIDIAGPDEKEIENYLINPVNGEGFTPSH